METKLACPPAYRSSECVYFAPNGDSYDLTQLAKTTGNWEARGTDGSVYLINVCRPLNLQGIGQCNPLSAACKISKSTSTATDIGLASSASFGAPPKSADSRVTVVLNYTHPSTSDDGCAKIYMSIQFVCNRTAPLEAGPRHLSGGGQANPCEHLFLWETRVVCPVKEQTVKACNITDQTTGYTFDLSPLKQHHNNLYTITADNGDNYTLTLCDALKVGECSEGGKTSVCQVLHNGGHHNNGLYTSMELSYIDNNLMLHYRDGDKCSQGDVRTTQIDFLCDRFAGDDYFGNPVFVNESSHCNYLFEWATPLACPPTELSCVAAGGKYNLKPLLERRNWFVPSENEGQQYVIGGCQAIDANSIPECAPSVNVGACLYTPNSGTDGDVLGYLTGDLVEVGEGHLKLSYHNGKLCPSQGLRSIVNVHFKCKPEAGAGNPVLESSGCVTEITWDTKYACAQDNSSKTWVITNPSTGQTYDLTKLTKVLTSEHKSEHSTYTYKVALTGNTIQCGDTKDAIICQSKGDTSYVVSRKDSNFTLQLVAGKVQFTTQNGDKCHHHSQINRKATVYFEYDPRDDYLMVLPEQGCEYSFVVFTKLVYEEEQEIGTQCYVENFPDLNWFTSYPTPPLIVESGNAKVYFSVCSPISSDNQQADSGYDACDKVSGACYVKGSSVINLGRPSVYNPPVVSPDGNAVLITYRGGAPCTNGNKTHTTKILLVCSNTASLPEVTYLNHTSCETIIVWRSPHACPLQIPITPISDSVCSIVDPSDGTTFNLQPLTTDDIHVTTTDGQYIFGLCGPINKGADQCHGSHAGVCHHTDTQWMKMADANHSLTIVSHSPHAVDLVYPTGESCDHHINWKIIVHIYCSHTNNSKQPFLSSNTDCELRFDWPTSVLCISEVEGCYVIYQDSTVLDLEPLISKSWMGLYTDSTVSDALGAFNISVCRNLNPTVSEGSQCYPGPSGICFQPDVTDNKYKNLGYMTTPPKLNSDSEIVLNYTNGDGCGSSGGNISTVVYLKCPESELSSPPRLHSVDKCSYEIYWSTVIACKQHINVSESCVANDQRSNIQYNFGQLSQQYTFNDTTSSSLYSVCLCPSSSCSEASIQNVTTSESPINLGKFNKLVVYPNSGPQFEFAGGSECPGHNQYSSTVLMFCDRSVTEERGRFVYEEGLSIDCHKFFSWWTPVACGSPQISCVLQHPLYDFTPIYSADGYWTAKDSKNKEEYLINICGPIHVKDGIGCSGDTAVCHKLSDGTYHDVAFASTQTLTINSNGNPEVHFNSIEKCSNSRYSLVVIEMLCGLKGLKFKSNKQCKYSFEWSTMYACSESEKLHTQSTCNNYIDSNKVYTYYPSKLKKESSGYHVESAIVNDKYHINLCGDETEDCDKGVAVCYTQGGTKYELGTTNSLSVTMDSYWMVFTMSGSHGSSVITVECTDQEDSDTLDIDKITLENEFRTSDNKLMTYFRMYTVKGCKLDTDNVSPPPSTTSPTTTKHSKNGKVTVAFVVTLLVVLVIIIMITWIVLWKKERREYVYKKLTSLLSVKADEPVRYVRAKTTDVEASLLENSSSDDEQPIFDPNDNATQGKKESVNPKQKRKKKSKTEEPLVAEYKDEDPHLSDEELLNI